MLSVSLVGCEEEDKTPTTIIEGKVVWYDTQEPVSGVEIYVIGYESRIEGQDIIKEQLTSISDLDGNFKFEINNYDGLIDRFSLSNSGTIDGEVYYNDLCYSECPRDNIGCKGQSECGNIQKGSNKFFTIEFLRDTE